MDPRVALGMAILTELLKIIRNRDEDDQLDLKFLDLHAKIEELREALKK